MALALLQGCAGRREEAPEADPAKIRAQLLRLLPAQVKDREGWANDIQAAFEAQRIAPSKSNLCAVLAVTEQESTFTADPQVPNLGVSPARRSTAALRVCIFPNCWSTVR